LLEIEVSIVVVIVVVIVFDVVGRVTAFYWRIEKHFNFTGDSVPQGPPQGTLSPVSPLAYGTKV
jgi:flagellar basal body-associated protein FliL